MATEQERIYDECMSQIEEMINNFDVYQANAALDGLIKGFLKTKESEEKSMLHNVTVKHEENKVLEKYWLMRAIKDGDMYGQPPAPKRVIAEREYTKEPTPQEIAQFLSDSKADFVSVVQNYRFENELPFC